MLLYAGQLLFSGHPAIAGLILGLAGATRFAMRQMLPAGPGSPRRLMLAADGRLHLALVGGEMRRVQLGGESLWLGSAVLLVLRGEGFTHRLLLGRGNVDPDLLAALRRRLRNATTAASDPALDCPSGPEHGAGGIEQFMRGKPLQVASSELSAGLPVHPAGMPGFRRAGKLRSADERRHR